MASNKSTPAGSRVLTMFAMFSRGHLGNDDLKSGNAVTPGHVFSFGVPRSLAKVRCCDKVPGPYLLEDLEDLIDL